MVVSSTDTLVALGSSLGSCTVCCCVVCYISNWSKTFIQKNLQPLRVWIARGEPRFLRSTAELISTILTLGTIRSEMQKHRLRGKNCSVSHSKMRIAMHLPICKSNLQNIYASKIQSCLACKKSHVSFFRYPTYVFSLV